MKVRYAVTFEFDTRPPVTQEGTVEAGQPHACMARATKAAQKALRPREWSSCVCVLLERLAAAQPAIRRRRAKGCVTDSGRMASPPA